MTKEQYKDLSYKLSQVMSPYPYDTQEQLNEYNNAKSFVLYTLTNYIDDNGAIEDNIKDIRYTLLLKRYQEIEAQRGGYYIRCLETAVIYLDDCLSDLEKAKQCH